MLNNSHCFCHTHLCFRAKPFTAGAANSLSPCKGYQAAKWGHRLLLPTSPRGSRCRRMLTHRLDIVCHPRLGSFYASTRPPAAVVASYSPKEMKFHLNEIRGLDGDQALQMCSEDITICTQKPAMSSDSSPIATETCAKSLDFLSFPTTIFSFCSDEGGKKKKKSLKSVNWAVE